MVHNIRRSVRTRRGKLNPGDIMSQGIQFIDIIFLGLVAGFLVLRLRSVLGRRNGHERPPHDAYGLNRRNTGGADDNVVELPGRRADGEAPPHPSEARNPVEAGLTQIRLADPAFEVETFMAGARKAFEMIVEAYAKGDTRTLQPLLADDVYRNFEVAIRDRESRGETMQTEIVSMKNVSIERAEMRHRTAMITVRFVSEQMIVVRDRNGTVIEGDPTRYEMVTDLWTFSRDTSSRDPNWRLVATETPDEAEEEHA